MGRSRIRFRPDAQATFERIGMSAVKRAAKVTAERANANVIRKNRVDTGKMSRSFKTGRSPLSRPGHPVVRVSSKLPYTKYQEFGTRAHGPKNAKALRFKPKGSNVYVFAKWVRGVQPGHFLRDARRALRRQDFLR